MSPHMSFDHRRTYLVLVISATYECHIPHLLDLILATLSPLKLSLPLHTTFLLLICVVDLYYHIGLTLRELHFINEYGFLNPIQLVFHSLVHRQLGGMVKCLTILGS